MNIVVTTGDVFFKTNLEKLILHGILCLPLRAFITDFQYWDAYLVLDIKNHIQLSEPWLCLVGCALFVLWLGPSGVSGILLGLKLQANGTLPFSALFLLFTWKVLQEGTERKGVSDFKPFYLSQEYAPAVWHWECGSLYLHVGVSKLISSGRYLPRCSVFLSSKINISCWDPH